LVDITPVLSGHWPNLTEITIFPVIRRDLEEATAMLARDEDILKAAEDWRREGRGVALATVVETWGSAPRPVGSNLVIDNDGNFLGSVSGGCVEGAVVTEAMDVIDSGKPRMLEFGVADETAWKVGLSCGGTIRVYVEKVE
jgi:xanthine/CO dehydrogenase XdhC/CoxF family maturation factor